jgi:hypothetical protein
VSASQYRDNDASRASRPQSASAFVSRRSRGHDIVHEKKVASARVDSNGDAERAAYVLAAGGEGLLGLERCMPNAAQPGRAKRETQAGGKPIGQGGRHKLDDCILRSRLGSGSLIALLYNRIQ